MRIEMEKIFTTPGGKEDGTKNYIGNRQIGS